MNDTVDKVKASKAKGKQPKMEQPWYGIKFSNKKPIDWKRKALAYRELIQGIRRCHARSDLHSMIFILAEANKLEGEK